MNSTEVEPTEVPEIYMAFIFDPALKHVEGTSIIDTDLKRLKSRVEEEVHAVNAAYRGSNPDIPEELEEGTRPEDYFWQDGLEYISQDDLPWGKIYVDLKLGEPTLVSILDEPDYLRPSTVRTKSGSIPFLGRLAESLAAITPEERAEYEAALEVEREQLRLAEANYEARNKS